MKSVNPYLNFDGDTEQAFTFYQSIFGGELNITRFKDLGDDMGATGTEADKIAHINLPLANGIVLMGSDVLESMGHSHVEGNNFYINLETESGAETEQLFNALADGGEPMMPVQETEWAERFGMCTDKYGVQWMVNYPGEFAKKSL